jgi:hypothetical protein
MSYPKVNFSPSVILGYKKNYVFAKYNTGLGISQTFLLQKGQTEQKKGAQGPYKVQNQAG